MQSCRALSRNATGDRRQRSAPDGVKKLIAGCAVLQPGESGFVRYVNRPSSVRITPVRLTTQSTASRPFNRDNDSAAIDGHAHTAGAPSSTAYSPHRISLPGALATTFGQLGRSAVARHRRYRLPVHARHPRCPADSVSITVCSASGKHMALTCGPASIVKNTGTSSRCRLSNCFQAGDRCGIPVNDGRPRCPHDRVHLQAVVLGDAGKLAEIPDRYDIAAPWRGPSSCSSTQLRS